MRHKHSIFKHLTIIHSHGDKNQPASAQYIVAWVCAGNKMKRLYFCSSLAEKREDKLLFNLLLSSLSCAMWLHQLKLVLWSTLQIPCSRWALPVSMEVLQTNVASAVVLVLFLSCDEWCVSFFWVLYHLKCWNSYAMELCKFKYYEVRLPKRLLAFPAAFLLRTVCRTRLDFK